MRKILSLKEFVEVLKPENKFFIKFPGLEPEVLQYSEVLRLSNQELLDHIFNDRLFVDKLIPIK